MAPIRLQAVNRQDHPALCCQSLTQPRRIAQPQRHQLLVPVQQHRHTPLGDLDPTRPQNLVHLVHLGHAPLLTVAQLPHQCDDIQPKLGLRQRPGACFLRHVGVVIGGAVSVLAAAHPQRQSPDAIQPHHPAGLVIGDPQALPTRGAVLALRGQHARLRHRARPAATACHPRLLQCFLVSYLPDLLLCL